MPFTKGKSGNMNGRPIASFSLVQLLKDKLKSIPEGEKEMVATIAINSYLKHLAEGKVEILKDAFDRVDGKPKQSPEDLGSELNPIHQIHHVKWD